jgi:DNA invertase Pin-like site-specific DNA recombinase
VKQRCPGALGGVRRACSQYKWFVTASAKDLQVRESTADPKTDSQTGEFGVFCQAKGYAKVRLFVEHESGAKVTRPQLDAMMSAVRTGKVDGRPDCSGKSERSLIREPVNAGLKAAKARWVRLGYPSTFADRHEGILQLTALGVGL